MLLLKWRQEHGSSLEIKKNSLKANITTYFQKEHKYYNLSQNKNIPNALQ